MKGIQHVEVSNRDASFKFDLYRNITIVRGESGTGKTTLYDMISDYTRLGSDSGINVKCQKKCVALVDIDWKNQLQNTSDSIVFIDEGMKCISSREFAEQIKNSDNYYIIFNRENLHELPYSVNEIYEIKSSGKYHSLKRIYNSTDHHGYYLGKASRDLQYDTVITEDSKSGFQFYNDFFSKSEMEVLSAESNSGIFKWLDENKGRKVLVIADGAAFGSEIDRVLKLQSSPNFRLCLPESFEWLILKSGLIKTADISFVLDNTSDYVESSEYFSWENFFENYLIQNTVNTQFQYAKREINPVYLIEANSKKIAEEIGIK